MPTTLAQVLRHFGPGYLRTHGLSTAQARAWRAIVACRTAALGGERLRCDGCDAQQWRWHSCRNRHCPQCQSRARDAWRAARLAELLDVPYCHLVFTLPHELNALAGAHPRWLGGIGAFTLVLHTWTQDLRRHLHVHALMACGALQPGVGGDGRWIQPRRSRNFLFPVHALSRAFRGKFMQALAQAGELGTLARDPADTTLARQQRVQALRRHDWVVYAKTPLAGPGAVLDYLCRYTHRTAIGNERLVAIVGDRVLVRVRADDHSGKRTIAMPGEQFIGRLMQHVLPPGYKRIRHYGLLAPAAKTERLATARKLLAMPAANARARAGLHAPRGGHRRRVLRALQARALARRRTTRRRSHGDRGAPCSADAGGLPRAAVSRILHSLPIAVSACHRRPQPSYARLGASLRSALHCRCRIARAAHSSRSRELRVAASSVSPPIGIAHTGA